MEARLEDNIEFMILLVTESSMKKHTEGLFKCVSQSKNKGSAEFYPEEYLGEIHTKRRPIVMKVEGSEKKISLLPTCKQFT